MISSADVRWVQLDHPEQVAQSRRCQRPHSKNKQVPSNVMRPRARAGHSSVSTDRRATRFARVRRRVQLTMLRMPWAPAPALYLVGEPARLRLRWPRTVSGSSRLCPPPACPAPAPTRSGRADRLTVFGTMHRRRRPRRRTGTLTATKASTVPRAGHLASHSWPATLRDGRGAGEPEASRVCVAYLDGGPRSNFIRPCGRGRRGSFPLAEMSSTGLRQRRARPGRGCTESL